MSIPTHELVAESPDSSHVQIQIQQQPPQEELNLLLVTWNLMGTLPSEQTLNQLLRKDRLNGIDLIVIGTQQCQRTLFASFFCQSKDRWESVLSNTLNIQGFVKVESHVLQGLHLIVFSHSRKYLYISEKKKNTIKTGFCRLIGNKGGISVEFLLNKTRLAFINVHLASNQEQVENRNISLLQIMERLLPHDGDQTGFLFGDMNYRINLNNQQSKVFSGKSDTNFNQYLARDQLVNQKDLVPFLQKFEEGKIGFPPTYKFKVDKNEYVPTRIPGWTDRIFYNRSSKCKLLEYFSDHQIFGSDHRPVLARFQLSIDKPHQSVGQIEVKTSAGCLLF